MVLKGRNLGSHVTQYSFFKFLFFFSSHHLLILLFHCLENVAKEKETDVFNLDIVKIENYIMN